MHTQKYQEIYDSVKLRSTQKPEGDQKKEPDNQNGWPEDVKNYEFSDEQFHSLKAMTS